MLLLCFVRQSSCVLAVCTDSDGIHISVRWLTAPMGPVGVCITIEDVHRVVMRDLRVHLIAALFLPDHVAGGGGLSAHSEANDNGVRARLIVKMRTKVHVLRVAIDGEAVVFHKEDTKEPLLFHTHKRHDMVKDGLEQALEFVGDGVLLLTAVSNTAEPGWDETAALFKGSPRRAGNRQDKGQKLLLEGLKQDVVEITQTGRFLGQRLGVSSSLNVWRREMWVSGGGGSSVRTLSRNRCLSRFLKSHARADQHSLYTIERAYTHTQRSNTLAYKTQFVYFCHKQQGRHPPLSRPTFKVTRHQNSSNTPA